MSFELASYCGGVLVRNIFYIGLCCLALSACSTAQKSQSMRNFADNGPTVGDKSSAAKKAGGSRYVHYTCSQLTKARARELLALGHSYLDRNKNGDPCENLS